MSLSILARSSVLRQQALAGARSFHASARSSSAHGDYHHLPFAFPGNKKIAFGVKLTTYLVVGFSIPFAASWWQIEKSKGA
ncbi:hypothetical protein CPB83DRAFT_888789 [Crepidotus variabilis]|uniref:Cytochrome c oxidase subunit 8, mitochondrial n=1 Tax=Crepidotus variabilis TaxID=179855 RepID=A0A9P6JWB8_9AGAR|nr:hypothetical protein CPB83DRAFT_888789 [Crepidotus variabilis]